MCAARHAPTALSGARVACLATSFEVPGAEGHQLFESPAVTYTPFAPGGTIGGTVASGWEPVQAAFAENFGALFPAHSLPAS